MDPILDPKLNPARKGAWCCPNRIVQLPWAHHHSRDLAFANQVGRDMAHYRLSPYERVMEVTEQQNHLLPPQRERKQRVASGDRDVLTSIHGEAHRGGLNRRAERDVPQRLARLRVQRDEIALPVP